MFWSDTSPSLIAVAGLDGSGFRVLINTNITVPGASSIIIVYIKMPLYPSSKYCARYCSTLNTNIIS